MKYIISTFVLFLSLWSFAQEGSVSGQVTDENGEPVPFANAFLDNTNFGVTANVEGRYEMKFIPQGEYTLTITFVGCTSFSQPIEIKTNQALTRDVQIFCSNGMEVFIGTPAEIIEDATRSGDKTPIATTNVDMEELQRNNVGQDLPFLLQNNPSVVVTSDAGAGVGYTGIRIRGSDASRVNVTVNGIPYNDSESQGTFWVNMPDIASSADQIQIQRGVGTSTNGAGAFGGSVKVSTMDISPKAYGAIASSVGSFNTFKNTVQFGSGLLNDRFAFEGRLSNIQSDGFIDRAESDLKSYYMAGAWYGNKTSLRAIVFGGKETTYQSWWGTPQSRIENDVEGMLAHAANNGLSESQKQNLLNSDRTYNFYEYENQVDNYNQDHYQLHFQHRFNPKLTLNVSPHYTYGRGYFEQFKEDDDELGLYGIDPIILSVDTLALGVNFEYDGLWEGAIVYENEFENEDGDSLVEYTVGRLESDIIRRRWLDNHFYGAVGSLQYKRNGSLYTLGFGANRYQGDHFGEVIWAENGFDSNIRDNYYFNDAVKDDFNVYAKAEIDVNKEVNVFGDLQYRMVNYKTVGLDSDRRMIDIEENLTFINPKLGLNYQFDPKMRAFASFAIGQKEPNRNDYVDALPGVTPKPEQLQDLELGLQRRDQNYEFALTLYNMNYVDQLVSTGELNDVGNPVRANVDKSYRRGVELEFGYAPIKQVQIVLTGAFSQNKIAEFNEIVYDYTNGFDVQSNAFTETDIAFSPSSIATAQVRWMPIPENKKLGVELSPIFRHVGKQFLDNTSNDERALDAYQVLDFRTVIDFDTPALKNLSLNLLINNVLNTEYSSNGYTYGYIDGDLITENFEYPQAGTNFILGLNLRF